MFTEKIDIKQIDTTHTYRTGSAWWDWSYQLEV
ncbi:hypothetical protein PS627_02637 [Pseudomonas fluorescens]|nr:hypothetical protein PS627_02637 [Pseudomonas fluorescens]